MTARTLFRVECPCGRFSAATDSGEEARRIGRFHENWNSDLRDAVGRKIHVPRITASVVMPHQTQVILEQLPELLA